MRISLTGKRTPYKKQGQEDHDWINCKEKIEITSIIQKSYHALHDALKCKINIVYQILILFKLPYLQKVQRGKLLLQWELIILTDRRVFSINR